MNETIAKLLCFHTTSVSRQSLTYFSAPAGENVGQRDSKSTFFLKKEIRDTSRYLEDLSRYLEKLLGYFDIFWTIS